MKRAGTAFLLSILALSPLARGGEAEAAKLEELVPGAWYGYHATGGGVYRHYFQIRKWQKQGDKQIFMGAGIVWFALPDEVAIGCTKGRQIRGNWMPKSCLYAQNFVVTLEGSKLTLKGQNARRVFRGGKYVPDTFVAELKPPGLLVGEKETEHVGHETFLFIREELLKKPLPLDLEKGKVLRNLTPLAGGKYHYSLYIPKSYDPAKPAPLLLNCSPGGGAPPLSPRMAEKHGWIMAGLSESRNGPLQPSVENIAATLFDLRRRFNLDTGRSYFSGFSGGARLASWCAYTFPGAARGLICMGAGYYPGNRGRLPEKCAVFFIVGKTDSNHKEVTGLFPREKTRRKAEMIIHPGGHSWGRKEDQEKAIEWLEKLATGETDCEPK